MSLVILNRRRLQQAVNTTANTFIGGVSTTITTKGELATKLGIAESNIGYFGIVGSDIEAAINIEYNLPYASFDGSSVTYFDDNEGKVQVISKLAFRNCTLSINFPKVNEIIGDEYNGAFRSATLTDVDFPELITLGGSAFKFASMNNFYAPKLETAAIYSFDRCSGIESLNMPSLLNLGTTTGDDGTLNMISGSAELIVPAALQTVNAGAEEGDIAYARSRGCTITYN